MRFSKKDMERPFLCTLFMDLQTRFSQVKLFINIEGWPRSCKVGVFAIRRMGQRAHDKRDPMVRHDMALDLPLSINSYIEHRFPGFGICLNFHKLTRI